MTELDVTPTTVGVPRVAATLADTRAKAPQRRPKLRDTWWRHVVGIVSIVVSLFPVIYIVSSAFNADSALQDATPVPAHLTTHNFTQLFHSSVVVNTGAHQYVPYLRWFANTVIIASLTALLSTLLGALAAYAFSRFRFRGRRLGMLALLLIQMFPQMVAIAAIYLIVYDLGGIFPQLGLDRLITVVVVYMGGAMGVQTWLMKGFFDTIPAELDESARVDGATPAQIFWGVVLPLATPVLAVVALISFVTTINEFVIASTILQSPKHLTLPVGMQQLVNGAYDKVWGPFAAGALMAALPVAALFMFLQRWIVSGLTAGSVKG